MPPKAGAGIRFDDRIGSYVVGGLPPGVGLTNVSFEAWLTVRYTESESSFFGVGNANGFSTAMGATGAFSILFEGNRYIATGLFLGNGQVVHLAYVVTGAGAATVTTVYFDGVQVFSNTGTAPIQPTTGYTLGAMNNGGGRRSRSTVHSFRAYARALTADEVFARYRGREIDRTGLALDLPLDDGLGGKALDRSGNLLDGTLTGGPLWVLPKPIRGTFLDMPVTSNVPKVTIPASVVVNTPALGKSVMAWCRSKRAVLNSAVAQGGGNAGYDWMLGYDAGSSMNDYVRTAAGGVFSHNRGSAPGSGAHHLAMTADGVTLRSYTDGIVTASSATTIGAYGLLDGQVGTFNNAGSWPGEVWDLAIFDRVLSQTEIRAIMLGLVDPTDLVGCVGWFPLGVDTLNRAPVPSVRKNLLARQGFDVDSNAGGWNTSDAANVLIAPALLGDGTVATRVSRKVSTGIATVESLYGARPTIVAGRTYTVSVDVAAEDAVDKFLTVDVAFYVPVGSFTQVGAVTTSAPVLATNRKWVRVSVSAVAPAGASTIAVSVRNAAGGAPAMPVGEAFYVRRWTIAEGADASFVPASAMTPADAAHGREVSNPRPLPTRARAAVLTTRGLSAQVSAVLDPAAFGDESTVAVWVQAGRAMGDAQYLATLGGLSGGGEANTHQLILWRLTPNSVAVRHGTAAAGLGLGSAIAVPQIYDRPVLVVATRDAVIQRQYQDGQQVDALANVGAAPAVSVFRLGAVNATPASTDARYGAARVWNRALSAAEVAGLMRDVVPRFGLQGEWLTDGSVVGSVAIDTSGKGRHGTLSAGAVAA